MRLALAVALAVMLGLSGCGGDSSSAAADSSSRCVDVPQDLQAAIAAESKPGVQITPVDAAAVKSDDFKDLYFIAMSFTAPGVDDPETGIWATTVLKADANGPAGVMTGVDGFAHQFTTWQDASERGVNYPSDDGIQEAKACLE